RLDDLVRKRQSFLLRLLGEPKHRVALVRMAQRLEQYLLSQVALGLLLEQLLLLLGFGAEQLHVASQIQLHSSRRRDPHHLVCAEADHHQRYHPRDNARPVTHPAQPRGERVAKMLHRRAALLGPNAQAPRQPPADPTGNGYPLSRLGDLTGKAGRGSARVGPPAVQRLEERYAEAELIRSLVRWSAAPLLRGDVQRRSSQRLILHNGRSGAGRWIAVRL